MLKLAAKHVAKPWGRRDVDGFIPGVPAMDEAIGEIWFEAPFEVPLLIKFLFTSEPLSIQVHPDDAAARRLGLPHGKDEAWIVLDAEPAATIAIGFETAPSKEELRRAAQDGSLAQLIDWRPVTAGDVFYSPGGTVHALGAGLKLVEVQQNLDLTFRLYDFDRPRELQVDEAVAVAEPQLRPAPSSARQLGAGRELIAAGPAFCVERWSGPSVVACTDGVRRPIWLVPVAGEAEAAGEVMRFGEAWLLDEAARVELDAGASILVAYVGPDPN